MGHWSIDQVHRKVLVHGGPSSEEVFDQGLTDMRGPYVGERKASRVWLVNDTWGPHVSERWV